jgi:hypothetical protein
MRNAHKILVGKCEGKKFPGGLRHKWKDTIRMDLREIVWETVGWIHVAQDSDQQQAFVNMVMNLQVP